MRRALLAALAASALGALSGCSDFERLEFTVTSTPPADVRLTFEEIRIPEGVAVTTTATPMSSSGVMARDTYIELTSSAPDVIGVAWALPEEFREQSESATWDFVIYGANAGSATITVEVDGSDQAQIPAVVEPQ